MSVQARAGDPHRSQTRAAYAPDRINRYGQLRRTPEQVII